MLSCLTLRIIKYGSRLNEAIQGKDSRPPWSVNNINNSNLSIYLSIYIYIYLFISIYIYHHYHHNVVLVARISLTLSRHFSLSFIALGRSSGQHPVSSNSCWMHVRAGRPAFARPCVRVHKSTSLMSSSLLLQQCPACLVRLTWIVFMIGGRWPYSWCLVGCCRLDFFKIARSILIYIYIYIYILPYVFDWFIIECPRAENSRDIVFKVLDCDIQVRDRTSITFYLHCLTNILGKGLNLIIPSAMG